MDTGTRLLQQSPQFCRAAPVATYKGSLAQWIFLRLFERGLAYQVRSVRQPNAERFC